MRLFIAIELPEAARQHLAAVQQALKPHHEKASFTKPENLHLTLKFLGEVDDKRAAALRESLSKVRSSSPIVLAADRVECFPSRGGVRIIAAGMSGQVAALGAVHEAIEQRCKFLGFDREARKYQPHVTLARAKTMLPPKTREDVAAASAALWPGPEFLVPEFVLIRSFLKPAGSEYVSIARFALS